MALTRLRAELDRQAPRPVEVMDFFAAIEGFEGATDLSWQELQRLNVIDIVGDGIIHLRGWPTDMVADVHERVRLLDTFRGDHMTNGLLIGTYILGLTKARLTTHSILTIHRCWAH